SLLQSLKLHLEGLKRTQHGQILYNQIQRGLRKFGHKDGRIELVFVTFLHALLGKYATSPACDPTTRVKARLIQQRLTIYLPKKAPAKLPPKPTVPPRAAAPVGAEKPAPPTEPPKPAGLPAPVVESTPEPVVDVKPESAPEPASIPEPVPEPVVEAAVSPVETAPVATTAPATPSRQEKIEALEDTLAIQVTESIAVDRKFGELLENERETLKNLDSPLGEFNDLNQILVKGLNELIEEREALIEKMSSAGDYLKAVETDRERLRQELTHARKHSLVDELTGLPKRDVFVKQLEAEIGRVKRYGFALAVAVIDVDNLESINKRYGRTAGDAVLR
ncbi:MAG: GGDEF domain-containing protein, partial [Burkholderiales bacterium]|nr:GGDEF domain-containing protein [Burkholderiales bacterium]